MYAKLVRQGPTHAIIAMAMTLLISCGGTGPSAGIEGSGAPVASAVTTSGRITGFGSIFIDGVEYNTATAQIRIDEQPATEADLRVGHVVTVKGTINPDGKTGSATEVTLTSDVRGDVGTIDLANQTFDVLGQTVRVTPDTLFDQTTDVADLSALKPGTKVRVSGFPNSSGTVVASRVDGLGTAVTELQVSGRVKGLDATAKAFRVNNLLIDYRAATVSGALVEGSTATVRGTSNAASGTLVASQITVAADAGASGQKGQLEGLITAFRSNSDFDVDGQAVVTSGSTSFDLNGVTLGTDVFVKVRGTYNASHVLVAEKIEAKPSSASKARGLVTNVSATEQTVSVLGVTVRASASTTFEDRTNEQKRQFGLTDVRVGDYVEVRGVQATGAPLIATLVQRSKAEDRSYLEGIALDVARPAFKVLGVQVMTDSKTSFPGLGGGEKGAAAFYEQAANQMVFVRGTLNGDVLIADQVRIEAR